MDMVYKNHIRVCIILILALSSCMKVGPEVAVRKDAGRKNLDEAVRWLETECERMVRSCRRTMENGVAAFPPQVGTGYHAFWLRDYAYMLEGYIDGFSDKELTDACLLFVDAQRADGAGVDCIKYDGTPIYKPGYGRMGENPVADGSQFTVNVAWQTYRRTKDSKLIERIIDSLVKAMEVVPRNDKTSLVHIRPDREWDRCAYGFTDSIRKQGDVLFCSLLYVQASRQLADLLDVVGRLDDAQKWRAEAGRVTASIRRVFWDRQTGLFRAATVQCREPDIWGSAFSVYLDVASKEQSLAIAGYFKEHYSQIVQRGQLRHTPGGMYWEKGCKRDSYQNGAFWATPVGWFVYTLDMVDSKLADQTVLDMVRDFRQRGIMECVFENNTRMPDYLASGTLPLAGIRAMLARRAKLKN